MEIKFRVYGTPITQGSLKSFVGKNGKVCTFHDNPQLKFWRHDVQRAFWEQNRQTKDWEAVTDSAVALKAVFYLKPQTGRGRDLDKLIRAIGDALTGACYIDDEQINFIWAAKKQADSNNPEGVEIHLKTIE